jgi:DNA-binding transcriptional regulator YdaS (Cro superfamily)
MDALDRAIEIAGGVGLLADLIKSRQSVVSNWRARKNVSAEGCAEIERATDGAVTCEELRPDLRWQRMADAGWPWHAAGRPLLDVAAEAA